MTEKFNRIKQRSEEYLQRRVMRIAECEVDQRLQQEHLGQQGQQEQKKQASILDSDSRTLEVGNPNLKGDIKENETRDNEKETYVALEREVPEASGTKSSVQEEPKC